MCVCVCNLVKVIVRQNYQNCVYIGYAIACVLPVCRSHITYPIHSIVIVHISVTNSIQRSYQAKAIDSSTVHTLFLPVFVSSSTVENCWWNETMLFWLETMSTDEDDGADDDGDDHYKRERESRSNHARRYFNSQKLWVPLFALPCAVPHDYCWLLRLLQLVL